MAAGRQIPDSLPGVVREEVAVGISLLSDLKQDLRDAGRIRKQRVVFAAVLVLGVGIGSTTAIFSIVNGVLLKPLPYADPEALVRIVHSIGGVEQPYFSDAVYLAYVNEAQAFADVGVWVPGETATITGNNDPEEVRSLTASRGVLTTLGVTPEIGRWFSVTEDAPGARDVVMLSGGYWRRRFGANSNILEQTITVNGRPHQVVGVMPPGFDFGGVFDIVRPLRIDPGAPKVGFRLLGVARMKPDVTVFQAHADITRLIPIWVRNPAARARWAPALRPLKQDVVGDVGRMLWILLGAVGVVLLMACANVATLLLARAQARQREIALRSALGASRMRIARLLAAESLALALLSGTVGLGLAYGALRVLVTLAPTNLPRLSEIAIDAIVLGFALAVALMSALVFGMAPMLKLLRPRVGDLLAGSARSASLTPERQRSQQLFVSAQIALALVLLVSAGLMIRSFQALRHVEPGFTQPERVQTFTITIPDSEVAEPERVTRMQRALLEAMTVIPSVTSAAFTTRVPMGTDRSSTALGVDGAADEAKGQTPPNRQVKIVSPGTFDTLGTPLVVGRDFTWTDLHESRPVAIVSENLARRLWGTPAAALGKRVREHYTPKSSWWEIVGVAADVFDDGADQPAPATIYWPAQPSEPLLSMSGYQARRVTFVLRSDRAGTESLVAEVQSAVRTVDPSLPLAQIHILSEVYERSMARTSFTLALLATAATVALVLGVSGIYGIVAYAVSQRRREIGIRLAVGAQPHDVRYLFLRWGLVLGASGIIVGLVTAIGVTRLMQSLLFGIEPMDSATFIAMSCLLATIVALAVYLPSRRAASLDPVETLREI
jgi:predicted permease